MVRRNRSTLWYRQFDQETKSAAELHSADILAYEIGKNFTDLLNGKTSLRHPLKTLIVGIPHIMIGPDRPDLAKIDNDLLTQGWIQ